MPFQMIGHFETGEWDAMNQRMRNVSIDCCFFLTPEYERILKDSSNERIRFQLKSERIGHGKHYYMGSTTTTGVQKSQIRHR